MAFQLLALLPFVATALAQGNSTTNSSASACAALASSFPNQLFYPNSTNYTAESRHVWDRRGNLDPTCVFVPATTEDVSKGLITLNRNKAEFAVRGGGHMNYPGSNNINDGVLLSLGSFTGKKLGSDNSTVEVGPGNTWFDVYTYLDQFGLIAIGGRLKAIGVPGLTLIGGVHYFINKYGFAMDNVVKYEVVLGNGTIVNASASSSPDLFWALKGGANNFGIVTKFTLKTYAIPQVSSTIQLWNESSIQPFIKAVCDFTKASDASVAAGAVITINYDATSDSTSAILLGVQEGTESPPSRFAPFTDVPGTAKINQVTNLVSFSGQLDSPLQSFRIQYGHHTVKPDADQIYSIYQLWKEAAAEIADVEGLTATFVLNTAPKSAASVAKNNGIGNLWGLDDSEDHIWWQISTGWQNAEDDLRVETWGRQLVTHLHELNKAKGLSTEFIYIGDAAEWQDGFAGWADGNLQKAKDIRAKYDVDGVFTNLNWGGWKLGL